MDNYLFFIVSKFNYWGVMILIMIGIYAIISKQNLIKKIIGMNIFQTAIILFYISIGSKKNASIPILHHLNEHTQKINPDDFVNPLPHVLMLTAIVVSVATLGVALSLAIKIYQQFGTLEENIINNKIAADNNRQSVIDRL